MTESAMRGTRERQAKQSISKITDLRWQAVVAAACALSACATQHPRQDPPSAPAEASLQLRLTQELSAAPAVVPEGQSADDANKPSEPDQSQVTPPVAASGYEPPTTNADSDHVVATPADRPAAPAPAPENVPTPDGDSQTTATPAEPTPVFQTDVQGETTPGKSVLIGSRGPDDKPLDPMHLCDQQVSDQEEAIAHTRRRVEEMVCTASMWFDGLFGDRYYVSESREVNGTLELSNNYSQFYGNQIRVRFNAQVPLPNLNRHLSAFIGRDDNDDFIQDRFDNSTLRNNFPKVDDHEKVFAGLGYSLPSSDRFDTNFRAGVHGLAHPEAFVQSRVRYNLYADDNDLVNLRLTPFYTSSERLGVTAGADYSHVLTKKVLFRFSNVGTRSQVTKGLDWRSTMTIYQALLRIRSGLAYELFIRGETEDDVPLHEYGFQTTFRHPMFGGKLYGEWVLGYSFPREDLDEHRQGSYLTGVSVQMPFGKQK